MKEFKNFAEFYESRVKPLALQRQKRLNGKVEGGSQTEFARFRYRFKTWKVDEDALVAPLKLAYLEIQKGNDPFEIIQTEKGTDRLTLKSDVPKGTEGLYIYRIS